ncbi:MAG: glycosyltransferase [Chitinivibrionales bacterium]|nr:glycosyltransferase [Chitinivibrionales bacterium]
MNIIFFNSKTFLTNEIVNALKKTPDIRLINVPMPLMPPTDAAEAIFEQLKSYLPAFIVSVNDAGYDAAGKLNDLIGKSGSYQLNWFCDHPLYEYIFGMRQVPRIHKRIDFVTEEWFVAPMRQAGMDACFLPLAVDESYFNTEGTIGPERDVAFVGNSSLEFIDTLMGRNGIASELEHHAELIKKLKERYFNNPRENICEYLKRHPDFWQNKIKIDPEQFLFAVEWMVGYLYRRDFIVAIAADFPERFTCFGDGYWERFINPSQVSTLACYYTNLCRYYRSTRINLNINRVQIHTAFTQRIFDCKASGAFVLTERRALNKRYFKTAGPEAEIAEFDSLAECKDRIRYYLKNDQERLKIAEAGRENVLANHTYKNRIQAMLACAHVRWGI